MCLYISRYIFNVSCSTCLTHVMLNMLDTSIIHSQSLDLLCSTCLTCHMISFSFINLIILVFLLDFLFQEVLFIMSKHYFDHFFLIQFILVKNIQMSFSCNYCACLLFSCMLVNSSEKCNECMYIKKSCFFFF